jgi:hypothetical protein
MTATLIRLFVVTVLGAGLPGWAAAQQPYYTPAPNGYPRPPYSPYLNLRRQGNPAINYYGLVRPEIQGWNSVQNLQQQVNQLGLQTTTGTEAATGVLPPTGYPARFQDFARYFPGPVIGSGVVRPTGMQRSTAGATLLRPGTLRGVR